MIWIQFLVTFQITTVFRVKIKHQEICRRLSELLRHSACELQIEFKETCVCIPWRTIASPVMNSLKAQEPKASLLDGNCYTETHHGTWKSTRVQTVGEDSIPKGCSVLARHSRLKLLGFFPGSRYQPVCLSRAVWNWLIAGGIFRRVWRTAFWRWSLMYLGHLTKRLKSLLGWMSPPMPKLRVRFSKRGLTTRLVSGFLEAKGAAATFFPFLPFP